MLRKVLRSRRIRSSSLFWHAVPTSSETQVNVAIQKQREISALACHRRSRHHPFCNKDDFLQGTALYCCKKKDQRRFLSKLDWSQVVATGSDNMLQSKWFRTTEQFLDRNQTPLGSFDSLKWQLGETLIIYWSELDGHTGLQKSFRILDRMVEEASDRPNAGFRMNIYLVHAILKLWNTLLKQSEIDILPSQVLERIDSYTSRSNGQCCFQPTIVTYTIMLDGASRCAIPKERLEFTEKLLLRLIEESEVYNKPELRPNIVSFGTVINALAKSGSQEAAEKAETMLWRVFELHDQGWPNMEPNSRIYTTAIHAWANAGNPDRAESLLKKMCEDYLVHGHTNVKPNLWSFNAAISAWCKSSKSQAFESAEALLRLMIDLNQKGDIESQPDAVSYNSLLHKLSQIGCNGDPTVFEKAASLVKDMIQASETGGGGGGDNVVGRTEFQPNLITFKALFRLMAISDVKDKEKVIFWLKVANEFGLSEDQFLHDNQWLAKILGSY